MAIAVEDVVCREGDHMSAGEQVVDARLHQLSNIEVVRIHERRGRDAEDVLGVEIFGEDPFEKFLGYCCELGGSVGRRVLRERRVLRCNTAGVAATLSAWLAGKILLD